MKARTSRERLRRFFDWIIGREARRIALALEEGYELGKAEGTRSFVVRTLRCRFPDENEELFATCAKKLETKNLQELDAALDKSEVCSSANEFVDAL